MRAKTEIWLRGAAASLIGGFANSFLSALGITGAQIIGVKIDQLSAKQLLTTTIVGGLVGLAMYFKQSPLPPADPVS